LTFYADIVPGGAARRDPHRHRQPGRFRVKVRQLEQVFGFRLGGPLPNAGWSGDVFNARLHLDTYALPHHLRMLFEDITIRSEPDEHKGLT
jgi:hypothetical protein